MVGRRLGALLRRRRLRAQIDKPSPLASYTLHRDLVAGLVKVLLSRRGRIDELAQVADRAANADPMEPEKHTQQELASSATGMRAADPGERGKS